jgi:hypothetical protein
VVQVAAGDVDEGAALGAQAQGAVPAEEAVVALALVLVLAVAVAA